MREPRFRATCRKHESARVPDSEVAGLFETDDPALFEAHAKEHGWRVPWSVPAISKPWKPPRSRKLFEAKENQPGDTVGRYRTGQVWSLGTGRTIYVIPDELLPGEAYIECRVRHDNAVEYVRTVTRDEMSATMRRLNALYAAGEVAYVSESRQL